MAAVLDELTVATEAMYPDLNMSLLSRESAFARILMDRAVTDEEGDPIEVRVRYKKNVGGSFNAYDVLNTDPTEQFASGTLNWKKVYVNVTASEDDLVNNAGMNVEQFLGINSLSDLPPRSKKAIFNLFGKKMAGAIEDMQQMLADKFYGENNSSSDPDGIVKIIDSTGTYANIAPADLGTFDYNGYFSGAKDNKWAAREKDNSSAPVDLDTIGQGCDDANRAGADRVEFCFMSPDLYRNLELQLQGQKHAPNETLDEIGFKDNIMWVSKGVTFVADDYAPANTIFGVR